MANCVNINSKEFSNLALETGLSETVLSAKIGVWQEKNGTDSFPSAKDIGVGIDPQNKGGFGLNIENSKELEFQVKTINAVTNFFNEIGAEVRFVDQFKDSKGNVVSSALAQANILNKTVDIINDVEKRPKAWNKLPEEAAHFWYSLLKNNTTLKQELWDASQVDAKAAELFYDTPYGKTVNSAEDLREEAIGHLVSDAIKRVETKSASEEDYSFLTKFISWIKELLGVFKSTQEDPFEIAAISILTNDISDLMSLEEHNQLMNDVSPTHPGENTIVQDQLNEAYIEDTQWYENLWKRFGKRKRVTSRTIESIAKKISKNHTDESPTATRDLTKEELKMMIKHNKYENITPSLESFKELEKKYRKNGVSTASPIKLNAKKFDNTVYNTVREAYKKDGIKHVPYDEFINAVNVYLQANYLLGFGEERAFLNYLISESFKHGVLNRSIPEDIREALDNNDEEFLIANAARVVEAVGMNNADGNVKHRKISIRLNDKFSFGKGHFSTNPTGFGTLTYFYSDENSKNKDAVLLHEIQSDYYKKFIEILDHKDVSNTELREAIDVNLRFPKYVSKSNGSFNTFTDLLRESINLIMPETIDNYPPPPGMLPGGTGMRPAILAEDEQRPNSEKSTSELATDAIKKFTEIKAERYNDLSRNNSTRDMIVDFFGRFIPEHSIAKLNIIHEAKRLAEEEFRPESASRTASLNKLRSIAEAVLSEEDLNIVSNIDTNWQDITRLISQTLVNSVKNDINTDENLTQKYSTDELMLMTIEVDVVSDLLNPSKKIKSNSQYRFRAKYLITSQFNKDARSIKGLIANSNKNIAKAKSINNLSQLAEEDFDILYNNYNDSVNFMLDKISLNDVGLSVSSNLEAKKKDAEVQLKYFNPLIDRLIQTVIKEKGSDFPIYFPDASAVKFTEVGFTPQLLYASKHEVKLSSKYSKVAELKTEAIDSLTKRGITRENKTKEKYNEFLTEAMYRLNGSKPFQLGTIHNAFSKTKGVKLERVDQIPGMKDGAAGFKVDISNYTRTAPVLFGLDLSESGNKVKANSKAAKIAKDVRGLFDPAISNEISQNDVMKMLRTHDLATNRRVKAGKDMHYTLPRPLKTSAAEENYYRGKAKPEQIYAENNIKRVNNYIRNNYGITEDLVELKKFGVTKSITVNKSALNGINAHRTGKSFAGKLSKAKSSGEALHIIANSKSEANTMRNIAQAFQQFMSENVDMPMEFVSNAEMRRQYGTAPKEVRKYYPSYNGKSLIPPVFIDSRSNKITINADVATSEKVLGAIIYSLAINEIASNGEFFAEFKRLATYYKHEVKGSPLSEYATPQDILIDLFTNKQLIADLNNIEARDVNRFTSLWQEFVSLILDTFKKMGLYVNNKYAYYDMLSAGVNVIKSSSRKTARNNGEILFDLTTSSTENEMFNATPRSQSNSHSSKDIGHRDVIMTLMNDPGVSIKYDSNGEIYFETNGKSNNTAHAFTKLADAMDTGFEFTYNPTTGKMQYRIAKSNNAIGELANSLQGANISLSKALSTLSGSSQLSDGDRALEGFIMGVLSNSGANPEVVFLSDDEMSDAFLASSYGMKNENNFSERNTVVNGYYNEKENRIYINKDKANYKTLVHEALHGVLTKYLKVSNSSSVKELRAIYTKISKMNEFKGMHEIYNFDEFVDALFTSPGFIQKLIVSTKEDNKSLWENIVNFLTSIVNSIFGRVKTTRMDINNIMNIANEVVSEASKFREKEVYEVGGSNKIDYTELKNNMFSELAEMGFPADSITKGMNDTESVFAIYSLINGSVNQSTVKALTNIVSTLPISKRIEGDLFNKIAQAVGIRENTLSKSEEALVNSAIKIATKRLNSYNRKGVSALVHNMVADPQNLLYAVSEDNGAVLPELSYDDASKITKRIEKIIATRINAFKAKGLDAMIRSEKAVLNDIQDLNAKRKHLESISYFISSVSTESGAILSEFMRIRTFLNENSNIEHDKYNEIAEKIGNFKKFTRTYTEIIEDIKVMLIQYQNEATDEAEKEAYTETLGFLNKTIDKMLPIKRGVEEISKQTVAGFLDHFKLNYDGNVRGLLEESEDISWARTNIFSMAESGSNLLALTDYATKRYLENARISALEMKWNLENAFQKLKKSGVSNADFMYEKDDEGNLTGNLISDKKLWLYHKDLKKAMSDIDNDPSLTPSDRERIKKEWRMDSENNLALSTKYDNRKAFDKVLNTKGKREFYDTIIQAKGSLNTLMPSNYSSSLYKAPQITKTAAEMAKSLFSGKGLKGIGEAFSDAFNRNEWDTDVNLHSTIESENQYSQKFFFKELKVDNIQKGEAVRNVTLDQNQAEMKQVPIHFVRNVPANQLSTDLITGLSALADSVYKYHELERIIHIVELEKEIIKDYTKFPKKDSLGNKLVSIFKIGEVKYKNDINDTNEPNIYNRLDGYLDMVYYGNQSVVGKDISIGKYKVNLTKVADKFGMYVAINGLAFNLYAAIQNPIIAQANLRIEAVGGEFFSHKDLAYATGILAKELPKDVLEKATGTQKQHSKLALWIERMNVLQDGGRERSYAKTDTNNVFMRMVKVSNLFLFNTLGEYAMQTKTSLALANNVKLKDASGNKLNLWEAYEVVDGKMVLKEGITKEDGSKFTEKDVNNFIIKQNSLNNSLNGIYNDTDKSLMQRHSIGRFVMMFRKFMAPGYTRRFSGKYYSFERDAYQEGYHYTLGKFALHTLKDLKSFRSSFASNWNNLSENEKRNVFRSLWEIGTILTAFLLIGVFGDGDDSDRYKRRIRGKKTGNVSWWKSMALYQLYRFRTEIGFFLDPRQTMTILKSPAAAINQLDALMNVLEIPADMITGKGFKEIRSGKNKGKWRIRVKTEKVIPGYRNIQSWANPEDKLKFFTTD